MGYLQKNRLNLAIYLRDDFICKYCGRDLKQGYIDWLLDKNKRSNNFLPTVDHIVPESKGGKTSYDNLVTCCPPCNREKADSVL